MEDLRGDDFQDQFLGLERVELRAGRPLPLLDEKVPRRLDTELFEEGVGLRLQEPVAPLLVDSPQNFMKGSGHEETPSS